jgi:SAM-dependent methyltransferase
VGSGSAGSARPTASAEPTPLSAGFSYADGAFDAILAWDLVNYYDAQAARRLAGEMSRILKPGGFVYGWLHSRPAQGPDGPRRYRIIDATRIVEAEFTGRPLHRHLYQNRDIQKMFVDLRIVEMYFQKSGIREMLLEKRAPGSEPPPAIPAARPRSRFRID